MATIWQKAAERLAAQGAQNQLVSEPRSRRPHGRNVRRGAGFRRV